ncbi:MAG: hypothetical protein Q9167_005095 [Letrouitia subvulpina]
MASHGKLKLVLRVSLLRKGKFLTCATKLVACARIPSHAHCGGKRVDEGGDDLVLRCTLASVVIIKRAGVGGFECYGLRWISQIEVVTGKEGAHLEGAVGFFVEEAVEADEDVFAVADLDGEVGARNGVDCLSRLGEPNGAVVGQGSVFTLRRHAKSNKSEWLTEDAKHLFGVDCEAQSLTLGVAERIQYDHPSARDSEGESEAGDLVQSHRRSQRVLNKSSWLIVMQAALQDLLLTTWPWKDWLQDIDRMSRYQAAWVEDRKWNDK